MVEKFGGVFLVMNLAVAAGADLRRAGDVYLKISGLLNTLRPSGEI